MRYKENRRQETAEEVKKQQPRSIAVRQHGIEWKQCERVPSHFHKGAARHRFESGRGSTTQCRMAENLKNGAKFEVGKTQEIKGLPPDLKSDMLVRIQLLQ